MMDGNASHFSIYPNNTTFRKVQTSASLPEGGGADAPEGVGKTSESCFLQKRFCLFDYSALLNNLTPSVIFDDSSLGEGAFGVVRIR